MSSASKRQTISRTCSNRCRHSASGLSTSNLLPRRKQQDQALFERFRVRDVMQRDVVSVKPETPVTVAGQLLLDQQLGCLPVVNAANDLVGIVTSSDFVAVVTKAAKDK
jgi:CBS-domain-containing membrane protein